MTAFTFSRASSALCAFLTSSSRHHNLNCHSCRSVVHRRAYSGSSPLYASTNYLLKYDYVSDVLEKRGPHRAGHLDLANRLIAEGKCLSGGPTGPPNMEVPTGALFVFTDEESARLFVEEDPYVTNGIVTGHNIEEWNVVVQKE